MDRDAEWVEFSHDAMAGPGPVRVRQNLDAVDGIARGDDATARWVWPGATATARWLCDRKTEWIEGKHVVEIGSGTGLLGLVAARLGAASVTLTDLPSELPLLRENVETNRGSPPHCPVTVKPLKWGDTAAMGVVGTNFDVVLCSDALYQNDEVTQRALCDTLFGLCDRVTPGRVLFAYNFRENLAADAGFFGATGELFGDPTQHDLEDHEDIWLFEYRPVQRC